MNITTLYFMLMTLDIFTLRDLGGYTKKDDYDTPTRLLAGKSFEEIAPEGLHLMENITHYRNDLIALLPITQVIL